MPSFTSINPYNQQPLESYGWMNATEVGQKINAADTFFKSWRRLSAEQRAESLSRVADALAARRQFHAEMMTAEMGKPITEALVEVDKCVGTIRWFAANGPMMLANRAIQTEAYKTYVRYDPLGVLLAIMPWNFPYWQVVRFAIPAMLTGNTLLLKHAPNVTGCAMAIQAAFAEAGLGDLLQVLVIDTDVVEGVLADFRVKGVSLTGSGRAGAAVASLAGKYLKKSVLELGGNDAFVVLKDADLPRAAETALASRLMNAGQVCISAKRLIIESSVKEAFTTLLLDKLTVWQLADPMLNTTKLGPMARLDLATELLGQRDRSIKEGAIPLIEGSTDHCRISPIVLDNIQPNNTAFVEETFGPLIALVEAQDANHAIQLVNNSRFGLGASVWTSDLDLGEKLATQINTGGVFINSLVRSDPRWPIGGINDSGYGRELSDFGLKEFANAKTVYVAE